jgi:RimJ/RimL family protein N-acetyltransferase
MYDRAMSEHASDAFAAGRSHPSPPAVFLRKVGREDVPVLFRLQLDPESNHMAGTKPRDEETFRAAWERNLVDPGVEGRVVVVDGEVVGSIARFQQEGRDAVGYWIAREHWGRGIATRALRAFLAEVAVRPLHATAARTNTASIRVLERCGFRLLGYHMGEESERYVAREVGRFVLE